VKKSRWFLAAFSLVIVTTGCFTAQLPDAPEVPSAPASAPVVGLAKVQDLRNDQSVGTVGLGHFKLGSELDDYLYTAVSRQLALAGYRVTPLNASQSPRMKVINVALTAVNIASTDALAVPADAETRCEVTVTDSTQHKIYSQRYRGSISERVDSASLNPQKAIGAITAKMLDQMAAEIAKDPDFLKAIAPEATT
jgi:hypothetical protein